MQTDGDLWEIFWGAILMRGPGSVRITWVKGHATEDDIAKGISSIELRYGNDQADLAATAGTNAHLPGLLALSRWAAKRHADYVAFMHRIHKFIVAMCKAEKKRRHESKPKQPDGKVAPLLKSITGAIPYSKLAKAI